MIRYFVRYDPLFSQMTEVCFFMFPGLESFSDELYGESYVYGKDPIM